MGGVFDRLMDSSVAEDPDSVRAVTRFMGFLRPLLGQRQYAKELVEVGHAWQRADQHRDALAAFDEVVALRGDRAHDLRAIALSGQAYCRSVLHDEEGAVEAAEDAIALLEPLAVEKPGRYGFFLLQAWRSLGFARYNLGQLAEAVPALERYLRMFRRAPVKPGPQVPALWTLAVALLDLDRPAEALPYAEELVTVLRPLATADPAGYDGELADAEDLVSECRYRAEP